MNRSQAFRQQFTESERTLESSRIRSKYPDRVPIIVERDPRTSSVPELDKRKYLVPTDLTVGQFLYTLRKRIKLPPEQALFLFLVDHRNGEQQLPPTAALLSEMDRRYTAKDGFLYVTYGGENVFGAYHPSQ